MLYLYNITGEMGNFEHFHMLMHYLQTRK